jgi:hypothetical protein
MFSTPDNFMLDIKIQPFHIDQTTPSILTASSRLLAFSLQEIFFTWVWTFEYGHGFIGDTAIVFPVIKLS